MAKKKTVVIGGEEQGYVIGSTFFRDVDPGSRQVYVKGAYALPDRLLDYLVDNNIETVVLMEPYRRLTSDLTDWQDYGREVTEDWVNLGWTALAVALMAKR